MIKYAGVPIAAPSANKFGHVSPTKAEHVYKDFHKDTDVLIIDGGECGFGIESTVLKIEQSADSNGCFKLLVIRKGGISLSHLEQVIAEIGMADRVTVSQLKRDHSKPETENLEAPG